MLPDLYVPMLKVASYPLSLSLREMLDIPHTLTEADIPYERVSEIAELAYRDPSTGSNARPLEVKDFEALFTACCTGDLTLL